VTAFIAGKKTGECDQEAGWQPRLRRHYRVCARPAAPHLATGYQPYAVLSHNDLGILMVVADDVAKMGQCNDSDELPSFHADQLLNSGFAVTVLK